MMALGRNHECLCRWFGATQSPHRYIVLDIHVMKQHHMDYHSDRGFDDEQSYCNSDQRNNHNQPLCHASFRFARKKNNKRKTVKQALLTFTWWFVGNVLICVFFTFICRHWFCASSAANRWKTPKLCITGYLWRYIHRSPVVSPREPAMRSACQGHDVITSLINTCEIRTVTFDDSNAQTSARFIGSVTTLLTRFWLHKSSEQNDISIPWYRNTYM